MAPTVFMRKDVAMQLLSLAEKMKRKVYCGVLIGEKLENKIKIHAVEEIRNNARQWHQHFSLDRSHKETVVESLQDSPYEIVGEYHTHKKVCRLTAVDKELLKMKRHILWVVVTPNEVKAFDCSNMGQEISTDECRIFFFSPPQQTEEETKE